MYFGKIVQNELLPIQCLFPVFAVDLYPITHVNAPITLDSDSVAINSFKRKRFFFNICDHSLALEQS